MVRKKGVIGAIMAAVLLIGATGTAFAAPESADSLDDAINKGTDALSDAQDEKKQLQSNLSAAQAMKKELEKTYNPADIEDRLYAKWVNKKYFHAEVNANKKPYTIVIPPPNITGQLHMGHALDNTLQDIIIRSKRMQGYETLWMPGTDHASIATEAKIVEAMKEEGLTKDLSLIHI